MAVDTSKQTAADVMSTDLVTIRGRDTIHSALQLLAENRLGALPVVAADGTCLGIVSQGDIIAETRAWDLEDEQTGDRPSLSYSYRGVTLGDITEEHVEDLMSQKLVAAAATDGLMDVADLMLAAEVHHVPVVDEAYRLIGMVSTMDVLRGLRVPS